MRSGPQVNSFIYCVFATFHYSCSIPELGLTTKKLWFAVAKRSADVTLPTSPDGPFPASLRRRTLVRSGPKSAGCNNFVVLLGQRIVAAATAAAPKVADSRSNS